MKKQLLPLRFRTGPLLPVLLGFLAATSTYAGDATWLQAPVDNDWSNPSNWTPNTVPNATTDTASFGISDTTAISIAAPIDVASVTFEAGASAYALTVANNQKLTLWGSPSIINNSGIEQDFVAEGGTFYFHGIQTLDSTIHFEVLGGNRTRTGGRVWFQGNVNTGTASLDLQGSDGFFPAGEVVYFGLNNAGSSTIVLHRGVNGGIGGRLTFESGSASSANIIAEGSDNKNTNGGYVTFSNAGAGASTVTLQGPIVPNGRPATAEFSLFASAGTSTLLADGGAIIFTYASTGATARIVLTARGSLDVSGIRSETSGITIGSLEGSRRATVLLGAKELSIGSNNLSTTYSGVIQDGGLSGGTGGSLAKIGTGTLTLNGDNQYTGGTTVSEGNFIVANRTGSATGTGPVQVDGGRIGGAGTMAGALTIGSGSGPGAFLMPALKRNKQVTTTIEDLLTFNADGTYVYDVDTAHSATDGLVANGVAIDPNARFNLRSQGGGTLASGAVLIAIDNTVATPITGTFSGLDEGATISAGSNTYIVSYVGGDGNDFTLTVL